MKMWAGGLIAFHGSFSKKKTWWVPIPVFSGTWTASGRSSVQALAIGLLFKSSFPTPLVPSLSSHLIPSSNNGHSFTVFLSLHTRALFRVLHCHSLLLRSLISPFFSLHAKTCDYQPTVFSDIQSIIHNGPNHQDPRPRWRPLRHLWLRCPRQQARCRVGDRH